MMEKPPRPPPRRHEFEPLRWIGAYKLLKAALAIVGGLLVLRLAGRDLPAIALHWMGRLDIDPESHAGVFLLRKVTAIKATRIHSLAIWLFAYVPIAITEGIGLMRRKFWAEWLTVITTAALIPIEVREVFRYATWARVLVLELNLLVVAYLIVRIRHDQREHRRKLHRHFPSDGGSRLSPPANQQTGRKERQDDGGGGLGHRIDSDGLQ